MTFRKHLHFTPEHSTCFEKTFGLPPGSVTKAYQYHLTNEADAILQNLKTERKAPEAELHRSNAIKEKNPRASTQEAVAFASSIHPRNAIKEKGPHTADTQGIAGVSGLRRRSHIYERDHRVGVGMGRQGVAGESGVHRSGAIKKRTGPRSANADLVRNLTTGRAIGLSVRNGSGIDIGGMDASVVGGHALRRSSRTKSYGEQESHKGPPGKRSPNAVDLS